MKGLLALKKTAVIAAMCMAVLCLPGYSEPTPEQIRERTNLLVAAVDNNNVEQAKVCIKLGADVNATVYYHLHNGHEKYLTTNSNDIHYGNIETYTLLAYAIKYGKSKDIVELLIKAGTDVNAQTYGNTALMSAASAGNKATMELLIKAGADVNAKNNYDGNAALMYAASAGSKDTAEVLIKAGTDVNVKINDGWTALINAAQSGKNDVAEMLIKSGADNGTALIWAIKESRSDAVELLIKLGANVNAKNNRGETVLMRTIDKGNKDIAELLIKSGADVNAKSANGETALIWAASRGYKDIAELLIKSGADVNAKSTGGGTALEYAIGRKKNDMAEILIKSGADVDSAFIHEIQKSLETSTAELFIQLGANPKAKDSDGISALTYAMLYKNTDIANLLRAAGAKE